jgi:hypothetical protein
LLGAGSRSSAGYRGRRRIGKDGRVLGDHQMRRAWFRARWRRRAHGARCRR